MGARMRVTSSHRDNRRSHHALSEERLSSCGDCGAMHIRHHACENCGKYRGRMVVDVAAAVAKKEEKMKARAKEAARLGQETKSDAKEAVDTEDTTKTEPRPLSAEELSRK